MWTVTILMKDTSADKTARSNVVRFERAIVAAQKDGTLEIYSGDDTVAYKVHYDTILSVQLHPAR